MTDLLEYVRTELEQSRGEIARISQKTGISYDTVLRIKNAEGEPGYHKVKRLALYFQAREQFLKQDFTA